MGLDLSITAPIKPEGLFRRRPAAEKIFQRIVAALPEFLTDPAQQEIFWAATEGDILEIGLHPAEEPVRFTVLPGDRLQCDARTNGAGPGYHAFLVELLDGIGPRCKLTWQWKDAEGGPGDETGYHEHRDFTRLQVEMVTWLQHLARELLKMHDQEMTGIKISLPMEYPVLADDTFAMTILGPRPLSWFSTLAVADRAALNAAGADFFPWWTRGVNAAFLRGCGLAQAWTNVPWHPAATDEERTLYTYVLRCFERAKAEDPSISLPAAEIDELRALLTGGPDVPPAVKGIGYRRCPMHLPLPDQWTVLLPGYYHSAWRDDEQVYQFGDRAVRVSTRMVGSRAENAAFEEWLLGNIKMRSVDKEVLKMREGGITGRAGIIHNEDGAWSLSGYAGTATNLALITIDFTDPAEKDWAIATWQSLRHTEGTAAPGASELRTGMPSS